MIRKSKPTILYCDDKKKWLNLFKERHKGQYTIISTERASELSIKLQDMVNNKIPPDIILIDLYHSRFDDPAVQEQHNLAGQAAIDKLETVKKEVRVPINEAWNPEGYKMLEFARSILKEAHYESIPIAIYTEQGLSIATNEELETVAKFDGQWLIKGSTHNYESFRLKELLNEGRKKRVYTKTYTMLSVFGVLLLIFTSMYSYFVNRIPDFLVSFLSSAIIAIIPVIASFVLRRTK
ncbi:MAG: hypothetical protein JW864_05440 [Spirochaetes bacterium]|nr:hypothetical protein [Spirochaetota bacterium]